jgi:hypothetical protein
MGDSRHAAPVPLSGPRPEAGAPVPFAAILPPRHPLPVEGRFPRESRYAGPGQGSGTPRPARRRSIQSPSGSFVTRSAILPPKQHDKSMRWMNALATNDPLVPTPLEMPLGRRPELFQTRPEITSTINQPSRYRAEGFWTNGRVASMPSALSLRSPQARTARFDPTCGPRATKRFRRLRSNRFNPSAVPFP